MPHAYIQPMETFSPQEFFEESLPKVLATEEAKKLPPGTVTFRLFGDEAGAWTIDFEKRSVKAELAEVQDLLLEMDDLDFKAMMKGNLDIEDAMRHGRIRRRGDLELLAYLGLLLQEWGA